MQRSAVCLQPALCLFQAFTWMTRFNLYIIYGRAETSNNRSEYGGVRHLILKPEISGSSPTSALSFSELDVGEVFNL